MDANRSRFWMLADEGDYAFDARSPAAYDRAKRRLVLGSRSDVVRALDPEEEAAALATIARTPASIDAYGTRAYWDAEARRVRAAGAVPGAIDLYPPHDDEPLPVGQAPTDVCVGRDGHLYVALAGAVVLFDPRERFAPLTLDPPAGLAAFRLAAAPTGGVWALDPAGPQIAWMRGAPLPSRPPPGPCADVFRPCEESPDPPRWIIVDPPAWTAGERAIAIASHPDAGLALLSWTPSGRARLRLLRPDGTWSPRVSLRGASHATSLAFVSASTLAVLVVPRDEVVREALVYAWPAGALPPRLYPTGDLRPLRDHDGGPFLHGVETPPHYPTGDGSLPLAPISLPALALRAETRAARPFDSGSPDTVWHRIYLEALLPPHAGVRVLLAATRLRERPDDASRVWHEHRFGHDDEPAPRGSLPQGAWVPSPSELPFEPGMLGCPPERDRAGLFTALVQRAGRRGRTLRGRYLWVRVVLSGDARVGPEIAALRVYGPRFSYVDEYLPELYAESVFGADADAEGPATGADFLGRMLASFEGVLTTLEDKVAHAYLLTDARKTPPESLAWLAAWIGLALDPTFPTARRRAFLQHAARLARMHGTLPGLRLALDLATGGDGAGGGGAVASGAVIVLEDFRMRRVFATVLGALLEDAHDPLLGGLVVSSNAFVGDTLFLGDEASKKELLALYRDDLEKSDDEEDVVASFYDRVAHRVTILVHEETGPVDRGLIERIVALESPAHVETRIVVATEPFLVGIASLVGIDSFLGPGRRPRPVELGTSRLGSGDFVQRPPSLDPRLEGAGPQGGEHA